MQPHSPVSRRTSTLVALTAALLCIMPSAARTADAAPTLLRVALMVPRTQELAMEEKKYNKRIAELTHGTVQVRVYWGGVAGDDRDVLRKMRTGQIDGSPLGLELLSDFVRQALVLQSPALFTSYKQLDAVRAALTPDMDKEAYENGFKVMGWGDVGRLRLMSKQPMGRIADFKRMRPWLYPESALLKEFYKQIGATGIPLTIPEVYGGLQTKMIDIIWSSAVLAAALQWHTATSYISEQGLGFISGAFVFRRGAWDPLPDSAKQAMLQIANEMRIKGQPELRKADDRAFKKLVERGHKALRAENEQEWWDAGHALRKRMTGRIYTKELVDKAEAIAKKNAN